jgi:hypothetical protein
MSIAHEEAEKQGARVLLFPSLDDGDGNNFPLLEQASIQS